jgi:NADH dehydrogenase
MSERVLVLGGGLAGVACARELGDEGVEVTLVDRNDYHQFQPLLYQVASSQLPAEDIARPHRAIFAEYPSVDLVNMQVTAADMSARSLTLADGRTLRGSQAHRSTVEGLSGTTRRPRRLWPEIAPSARGGRQRRRG